MRVRIGIHSKGILVLETSSGNRLSAIWLRQVLGTAVSPLPGDSYLVPWLVAHKLLTIFPPQDNEWDRNVLELATNQKLHWEAQLKAQFEVECALDAPRTALANYKMLPYLDDHQISAVAAICVPSLKGLALFDEQGTGKTITTLAAFDHLNELGKVERLLVIAPKSVLGAWQLES